MTRVIIPLALALLGSGCFAGSVHPILAPGDRLDMDAAVGQWRSNGEKSEVSLKVVPRSDKVYAVTLTEGAEKTPVHFLCSAGKIGNAVWLDAQVDRDDPGFGAYRDWVYRPHLASRIALEGDTLKVWLVQGKWFEEQRKKGKVKIPFVPSAEENGLLLFTAPTAALQKAIKGFEKDEAAFGDPSVFTRVK